MPTPTYTPLATVTLGTAASSVTFSSIPATYRDLILVVNATTSADGIPSLRFNGDSGNNYSEHGLSSTGSVIGSGATSSFNRGFCGSLATAEQASEIFSSGVIDILDAYATKNRVIRTLFGRRTTSSPYSIGLQSSMYISTAAIT